MGGKGAKTTTREKRRSQTISAEICEIHETKKGWQQGQPRKPNCCAVAKQL